LGEFVGAFAVVATLIYLAFQIKQNTKVARSTVRQSIMDSMTSTSSSLMDSDELAQIVRKQFDDEPLEPHEVVRSEARCYVVFRRWEYAYLQHREGLVSTEEWASYRLNLEWLLENKFYQQYWSELGRIFTSEFQDEVRTMLPG
jgi:hypothetical protein